MFKRGIGYKSVCAQLCFLLTFYACSAPKVLPSEYKKAQLEIGNGGGFTGAVQKYYLQESGWMYQYNPYTDTYAEIEILDKERTKTYFKTYDSLTAAIDTFYHPANSYYFMNFISEEKKKQIVWGGSEEVIAGEIKALYDSIMFDIRMLKAQQLEEQKTETNDKNN